MKTITINGTKFQYSTEQELQQIIDVNPYIYFKGSYTIGDNFKAGDNFTAGDGFKAINQIKTSNQLLNALPKELQGKTENEIHAALVELKQVIKKELLEEMKKGIETINTFYN